MIWAEGKTELRSGEVECVHLYVCVATRLDNEAKEGLMEKTTFE